MNRTVLNGRRMIALAPHVSRPDWNVVLCEGSNGDAVCWIEREDGVTLSGRYGTVNALSAWQDHTGSPASRSMVAALEALVLV